jgi:hypothetical protein
MASDQDGAADSVSRLGVGANGELSMPGDDELPDGEHATKAAPRARMSSRRLTMGMFLLGVRRRRASRRRGSTSSSDRLEP